MSESQTYSSDSAGFKKDVNSHSNSKSSLVNLVSAQADEIDLDQLDADLGSIISNLSANSNHNNHGNNISSGNNFDKPTDLLDQRRNSSSFNGSDVESDFGPLGYRRATLSLGGFNQTNAAVRNGFGASASISGGLPSHASSSGSGRFLEKFSAVAEATREVELLSGGLGSLSIKNTNARVPSSRRTSFLTPEGAVSGKPFLESSPGSLNESLNNPLNPTSTRQSISERIDNYLSNTTSPSQAYKNASAVPGISVTDKGRSLSVSSDVTRSEHNSTVFDPNEKVNTNIWNTQSAAAAPTFTPMMDQPNLVGQPFAPQGYPQMFPYGFPFNQPPFPIFPMGPPQFQNNLNQQQGNYDEKINGDDGGNNDSSKENDPNSSKSGSNGPLHPQPQHPQPGFNGNAPPFIYPQAFSPFGFVPQINDPNIPVDSQQAPQRFNSSSPAAQGNNNYPHGSHANNNKRNGRSPKPSSPSSRNNLNGARGSGKGSKNQIYRSPLLEEFRNNTTKEYKLKDIFGNVIEFSKDQHGSRFIQQELGNSSPEEKEVIFNEIREAALELMTDVFGNYVIQKYFEYGTPTQRQVLLGEMQGSIKTLSLQMYGCRVVQRAIEFVELNDQISIISELKDSVLPCIKDQNGNHVIQKSIEKIPIDQIEFILENLKTQIYHLSTHPYGCRVIQRLLEYSKPEDQEFILDELNKFTYFLIQDQYGNYVIQHIIEHGQPKEKKAIFDTVSGSVVEFSKHKFASNVVEKCVFFGTDEQRNSILEEVLKDNNVEDNSIVEDRSPLGLMMKDQFANYVVQKLVDVAKGKKKRILVKKIRQYLSQISKSSYGKHLASIDKLIQLSESAIVSDDDE